MTEDELAELRKLEWMPSRIPVLDALSTFHPGVRADGSDPDPAMTEQIRRWHQARWYPIEGGFRVLVPNDGRAYDAARFSVEAGAWDHDTCDNCRAAIPAMTLCRVTRRDRYVAFCEACYTRDIQREP